MRLFDLFYRHGCTMTQSMEFWKSEVQVINSRCGFCAKTFTKWQDRADHLAKEFRNGATMRDWKGCRGLDPHVSQHVTNAMPPYLIANESKSPFPFSATNSASMKHPNLRIEQPDLEVLIPSNFDNSSRTKTAWDDNPTSADDRTLNTSSQTASPNRSPHRYATCWEILTLRLGCFAREHMEKHGPQSVTDAMLQSEARRILYDADDPWEQTAADNPEWLNLFRKAHGLDLTRPHAISNMYSHHEVLEDLGLGTHAKLDRSFDLSHFGCVATSFDDPVARSHAYECSLAGSTAISKAVEMSVPRIHMPGLTTLNTTSGASHLPATSFAGFRDSIAMLDDLEDTGVGGLCLGANGEFQATTSPISKCLTSSMSPIDGTHKSYENSGNLGYDYSALTTDGSNLGIHTSTAAFGMNLATTSDFGDLGFNNTGTDIEMKNPQTTGWDDAELTFSMDMDLDPDLGMGSTSRA